MSGRHRLSGELAGLRLCWWSLIGASPFWVPFAVYLLGVNR